MKYSKNSFDTALDASRSTNAVEELKDFYGVQSSEELDRINKAFRDRVETKKLNLDMSQVKYRKTGTNEYKARRFMNDATRIFPMGTEKLGSDLISGFEMSTEIQPPVFIEDNDGNIWVKI